MFYLAIENGNGQLYVMRENDIDIVEIFASTMPAFNLNPQNFTDHIGMVSVENLYVNSRSHAD